MASQNIEHYGSNTSDNSSDSSESIGTYSERTALLLPDFDPQVTNYKNTVVTDTEAAPKDYVKTTPKGVFSILSLLLIGVFISNADGTLVLATYATISSSFNSFGEAAWLTTSYNLALCAVQPIVGKLSDIYGRKGVLLTSYTVFALGSVLTYGSLAWLDL